MKDSSDESGLLLAVRLEGRRGAKGTIGLVGTFAVSQSVMRLLRFVSEVVMIIV